MLSKKLTEITEDDLKGLIENGVQESKTIEYKRDLKFSGEKERREFLNDVSSFANASGGDLIFGIKEEKGMPVEVTEIAIDNLDAEILKMTDVIRNGIEPRIPSVNIHPVRLSSENFVIVIRIGKSWISPHRVTYKGHDKFYTRSSAGKYPMDVSELRIAFNLSDTITDKIQRFRESRISNIIANETPLPVKEGAKTVLHIIPLISFSPGHRIEIENIKDMSITLRPLYDSSWNNRINFDGYLTYHSESESALSYTQLYRNGIIEACDVWVLQPWSGENEIASITFEKYVIDGFSRYFRFIRERGVELPFLVFLTLIGVKGYKLGVESSLRNFRDAYKIDRDMLYLPEILVENDDKEPSMVLKPFFDSIWNACGYSRSFNYDENGKWKGGSF